MTRVFATRWVWVQIDSDPAYNHVFNARICQAMEESRDDVVSIECTDEETELLRPLCEGHGLRMEVLN